MTWKFVVRGFLIEETGYKQRWDKMLRSGLKSKVERKKTDSVGSLLQSGLQCLGPMPLFCWDQWDFALGFRTARISLLMLITHAWPSRQGSHCNLECFKKQPVSHAYLTQYEDSFYVSERQTYLLHLKIIKFRFLCQNTLFTEQEERWACLDLSHMLTHNYPIQSQNHS